MRLFILGVEVPWGEERSMMIRFFPEYFLVAMPMGLIRKVGNGGVVKGPIMKPLANSLASRVVTVSGSVMADWRLRQW